MKFAAPSKPASDGAAHNPQQVLQQVEGFKAGNAFFQ